MEKMSQEEFVKAYESHQLWLENNEKGEQLKLVDVDLSDIDFEGMLNMARVYFNNVIIKKAKGWHSYKKLNGVSFEKSVLIKLSLAVVNDILFSNFSNCRIEHCDFYGSNFHGSNFQYAKIENSDFSNIKADFAQFNNTQIKRTDIQNAVMNTVDFAKSEFEFVDFAGASLLSCNFDGGSFVGVKFQKADLRGANLRTEGIADANFIEANLKNAYIEDRYVIKKYIEDGTNLFGLRLAKGDEAIFKLGLFKELINVLQPKIKELEKEVNKK